MHNYATSSRVFDCLTICTTNSTKVTLFHKIILLIFLVKTWLSHQFLLLLCLDHFFLIWLCFYSHFFDSIDKCESFLWIEFRLKGDVGIFFNNSVFIGTWSFWGGWRVARDIAWFHHIDTFILLHDN